MKVNGNEIPFKDLNLKEFLLKEGYNLDKIVVEANGKIVSKKDFELFKLSPEDSYEILSFVGGG